MILSSELTAIGKVAKTHGINGEINIVLYADGIDFGAIKFLVFDIAGINVPFFIKSVRRRGPETVLVTFEDIDKDADAAQFVGKEVFALTSALPKELVEDEDGILYLADIVGYKAFDADDNELGTVTEFDDSTDNTLFEVTDAIGRSHLIPAADDFIVEINEKGRTITFQLPPGFLDINK